MKVSITKRIVQNLLNNDAQNELVMETTQSGGSDKTFETPDGYNESLDLINDFDVKNVQNFEFNLRDDFSFSLEIFSLLKGDVGKVSFIEIWCLESTGLGKIPIRFDLSLGGAGGSTILLGRVSLFSLTNIKNLALETLTISNILLKPTSTATLFVSIGTSDKFLA